jgi:hypothetical protein
MPIELKNDKRRPFSEGKIAFKEGKLINENPYKIGDIINKMDANESWDRGFKSAELDDLISKTPIPDIHLIIEAENLIPKGSYWCGHELNRTLHYYKEACDKKDVDKIKLNERSLRQVIVRARLEAAGLPIK